MSGSIVNNKTFEPGYDHSGSWNRYNDHRLILVSHEKTSSFLSLKEKRSFLSLAKKKISKYSRFRPYPKYSSILPFSSDTKEGAIIAQYRRSLGFQLLFFVVFDRRNHVVEAEREDGGSPESV